MQGVSPRLLLSRESNFMMQLFTRNLRMLAAVVCATHLVQLPVHAAAPVSHDAAGEFLQRARAQLFDGSLVRQRVVRTSHIASNQQSMTTSHSFDLDWAWPEYLSYRQRSQSSRSRYAHILTTPELMHVVNADESAYLSLPHDGLVETLSGDDMGTFQQLFGSTFYGATFFGRIVAGDLLVDLPRQLVQYQITETERESVHLHLLRLNIPTMEVAPLSESAELDLMVSIWLEENVADGRIVPVALQYSIHPEVSRGMSGAYRVGSIQRSLVWHRVSIEDQFDEEVFDFTPRAEAVEAASVEELLGLPVQQPVVGDAEDLIDKAAPAFELPNLHGDQIAIPLAADDAPIVILDFWATWCVPCIQAMPGLIALADEFSEDDVRLLAVTVGEPAETARTFLAKQEWELSVLLDEEHDVSLRYKVKGIPHTVVLDRNGIVRHVHTGFDEQLPATLGDLIAELLRE